MQQLLVSNFLYWATVSKIDSQDVLDLIVLMWCQCPKQHWIFCGPQSPKQHWI